VDLRLIKPDRVCSSFEMPGCGMLKSLPPDFGMIRDIAIDGS